jgi:hypothetical protein
MQKKSISASPAELQKLAQRITEANQAKAASDHANAVAVDLFTMFCEGHQVPGASFVGIEEGHVIVTLPESTGPALVPQEPAA